MNIHIPEDLNSENFGNWNDYLMSVFPTATDKQKLRLLRYLIDFLTVKFGDEVLENPFNSDSDTQFDFIVVESLIEVLTNTVPEDLLISDEWIEVRKFVEKIKPHVAAWTNLHYHEALKAMSKDGADEEIERIDKIILLYEASGCLEGTDEILIRGYHDQERIDLQLDVYFGVIYSCLSISQNPQRWKKYTDFFQDLKNSTSQVDVSEKLLEILKLETPIHQVALLYGLGTIDDIAKEFREGPHQTVNCYKVAQVVAGVTGLKTATVMKNIQAIYGSADSTQANHPYNNPKNKIWVKDTLQSLGLEFKIGEK